MIAKVTVLPDPVVVIPEPPVNVIDSLFKSILNAPPLSAEKSRSTAVATESTYALIDCCEASFVALLDAMLSSSKNAVPERAVFNTGLVSTGLVKVLFVNVSVAVVVATVPLASGKVIVRSAVGSVIAKIVSWSSAVAPSKVILVSNTAVPFLIAVTSVFIALTASTISVEEAIMPLALSKSAISPTSPAVELNVVLSVSKVSVVATDLSAIFLSHCHDHTK